MVAVDVDRLVEPSELDPLEYVATHTGRQHVTGWTGPFTSRSGTWNIGPLARRPRASRHPAEQPVESGRDARLWTVGAVRR